MSQEEDVRFARSHEVGELRGDCPKKTLAVLDAVAMARGLNGRMPLVNEILGEWANKKLHEATLINRLSKDYPTMPERFGKDPENV